MDQFSSDFGTAPGARASQSRRSRRRPAECAHGEWGGAEVVDPPTRRGARDTRACRCDRAAPVGRRISCAAATAFGRAAASVGARLGRGPVARQSVAIVGARAATPYGLDIARRLAAELSRAGVVVVSGLARGIDAAAHEGALEAGGRTVAVQACGPELVYPASHARLAERIRESGAVVTSLPPGMRPRAPFFPLRNRMISALAELVVVVEARPRSGSLITSASRARSGRRGDGRAGSHSRADE